MNAKQFRHGCSLLLALCIGTVTGQADQPNIVLILADDMGYGDCTAFNPQSRIKTPHIDALAEEGLRFTDAHAAADTCTPSRYGLLTGINPVRTGVANTLLAKGDSIIAEDEKTLASMLQDRGYITRMIGKWHLGFEKDKSGRRAEFNFSKPVKGGPLDRGFDTWFGIHGSAGSQPLCYFDGRSVIEKPTSTISVPKERGGKSITSKVPAAPGFSLEETSPLFCRKAVEIIHDHAANKQGKPLFLYYASPIPHKPWVPIKRFQGKSGLGPYGDFVMQLDDVVGQVNRALRETGLDKNTLLIFTSDNGPGPDAWKRMGDLGHASSGVLRGHKANCWEGGHRIPFIAKWPDRIPASSKTSATVNFTDMFATLSDLVETQSGNSKRQRGTGNVLSEIVPADSVSFLPVLFDPSAKHDRPFMIHRSHAIREGDWKLEYYSRREDAAKVEQSKFELYNLAEDIGEQNDVADDYPETVTRLFTDFKEFANSRKLK
jgi:arylsulfatase A